MKLGMTEYVWFEGFEADAEGLAYYRRLILLNALTLGTKHLRNDIPLDLH